MIWAISVSGSASGGFVASIHGLEAALLHLAEMQRLRELQLETDMEQYPDVYVDYFTGQKVTPPPGLCC